MSELYKLWGKPGAPSSSLIIAWNRDPSRLGAKVVEYLNQKLAGHLFAEIEPLEFFPLAGVTIENDLIQFPESKFYSYPENALVVFLSEPPGYKWYEFLSLVLDIAQQSCQITELYTIGGLISPSAHTTPRELVCAFSSIEFKRALSHYNLSTELNYETPSDQRPTLNSFLLWIARKRNIPGVCLWVPIPSYMLGVGDPQAQRRVLDFFNQRFDLRIDFSDLDAKIRRQNEQIARLRSTSPEIDQYITKLESNLMLTEEENQELAAKIQAAIKEKGE